MVAPGDEDRGRFAPGAAVAVLSLGRKRGIVEGLIRKGLYRVQVESLSLSVRERDLEAVAPRRRRASPQSPSSDGEPAAKADADVGGLRVLDLHGLSVEEARNRVAAHVSRAIVAGLDSLEIVHGIGTGALRRAVTADLRALSVVKQVRRHPSNPGAIIVQF
jgi:DNA mismatch repair protein MutS2